MALPQEGQLLRILIGEGDRHGSLPLYEWLVREARRLGMAGATVVRGVEGFGARSVIHTTRVLRLSEDLPVIVEIIDTPEKIHDFLEHVDPEIEDGMATLERAEIRFYRPGRPPEDQA